MNLASVILALVTLQRFGELVLSRRNTERLLTRGAIEVGAAHYPLIVLLHAGWLTALWIWGRNQDVNLAALAAFVALQQARALRGFSTLFDCLARACCLMIYIHTHTYIHIYIYIYIYICPVSALARDFREGSREFRELSGNLGKFLGI